MNDVLQMSLLGPVVIHQSDQEVKGFRSRKASALLIYLACTQRPQRRETLADLLWGDCAPQQAQSNLRTTLVHLRDRLGDCLQSTEGQLSISPRHPCRVDTLELQRQLVRLLPNQRTLLTQPTAEQLEEALHLYQGDFLAGFHVQNAPYFEEWVLLEGERLRRMVIEGYQRLVGFYLAQGEYKSGLRSVDRWLALDRLDEIGHSQRMHLLAADGQRGAALAQYETCRRILQDDLGVEPVEQTILLYESIRTGQFEHQISAQTRIALAAPSPAAPPATPRYMNTLPTALTRFIGRKAELANIAENLAHPGCRLLTITGLSGMGKTALALQAAAATASQFSDGVCYVPIADSLVKGDVTRVILDALGLPLSEHTCLEDQLFNYVRQKQMLLLLDNLEYLGADATFVTTLLQRAPLIKVLGTSLEPLNQRAEWLLPLHGLPIPAASAALFTSMPSLVRPATSDSDQNDRQQLLMEEAEDGFHLFVLRARQAQPRFVVTPEDVPAIIRICRLVGGMPLAIEMAAEWVGSLSCQEIAEELGRNPAILTSSRHDVPARQQSLEAIFAHAWRLLSASEVQVLQNIASVREVASREIMQQMTGANLTTLASLVQKSFLWRTTSGRYETFELLGRYLSLPA